MMVFRVVLVWAVCLLGSVAAALDLPPSAVLSHADETEDVRYALPVDVYADAAVPSQPLTGNVTREAWHIRDTAFEPWQLVDLLASQLEGQGFEQVLRCSAAECGGFDFRFAIDVLPAPDMFVNLRSYVFASFFKGATDQPEEAAALLVSRSQDVLYVQVTRLAAEDASAVGATDPNSAPVVQSPEPVQHEASVTASVKKRLSETGAAVLEDLRFETGATTLDEGPFGTLAELAKFLAVNPGMRVALVGHTDSVGSLESNLSISKARAQAVRDRLIEVHGVPAAQVDAEGMGYLAPRASNLTRDGREANRRVEVIILSQE